MVLLPSADWVEFTPYEIGMAKYATFMNTKHFGSKFFMGVLAKQFDEYPLHFLMVSLSNTEITNNTARNVCSLALLFARKLLANY